jgi:hypothetical protein
MPEPRVMSRPALLVVAASKQEMCTQIGHISICRYHIQLCLEDGSWKVST